MREEARSHRMALRRKLDGVSEFAALQQIASEDGKNGARLKNIQSMSRNVGVAPPVPRPRLVPTSQVQGPAMHLMPPPTTPKGQA